jgi:tetratricopeptide (TPR) repeat protein
MKGLTELEARYPQDEYVLYWGGWAHNFFGEWDKALASYERSLEIDPGQCYVVGFARVLLARLGRDDEQLPMLQRAVEARPNAANRASLAMGLAHRQPEEAARQAREALRLATAGQINVVLDAACALASSGNVEEGVVAARRLALEGETDAIRALGGFQLATLVAIQGRPREAAEGFDPAWNRQRRKIQINERAALLAVGRSGNRAPLAIAELRNGPDVVLRAGEFALFGDLQGAAEAATTLSPGSPADVHYRAIRAAVERRWDEAIPALRQLVDAWKDVPVGRGADPRWWYRLEVRLLLGEALLETGSTAEALEVLQSADRLGGCGVQAAAHVPNILVLRARAHERLGRPADALKDLDRLLGLWKNAEPGLPLHAEAKAMRARLVAESR